MAWSTGLRDRLGNPIPDEHFETEFAPGSSDHRYSKDFHDWQAARIARLMEVVQRAKQAKGS